MNYSRLASGLRAHMRNHLVVVKHFRACKRREMSRDSGSELALALVVKASLIDFF